MPAEPTTLADWLEAVGTVAAVAVALFLGPGVAWWRRPRLRLLRVESRSDRDEDVVLLRGTDRVGAYAEVYHRVKVANHGRGAATGVRAFVAAVRVGDRRARMPDCHLKWSGPALDEQVLIPAGAWRRLDVLRYRKVIASDQSPDPVLALALLRPGNTIDNEVASWPPSERNQLRIGVGYEVDVVLSCDRGRTAVWRIELTTRALVGVVRVGADGTPGVLEKGVTIDRVGKLSRSEVRNLFNPPPPRTP